MTNRRFGVDFALIAAFTVLAVVSVRSAQGAKYGLKFSKDQLYYVRTVTDRTVEQMAGAKPQKTKLTLEVGINMDVNSVDPNGNFVLDCKYVLVKVKSDPGGRIDFDSTKKSSPGPVGRRYAALVDEQFRMHVAPSGRVERFRGLKQMEERISKKVPETAGGVKSIRELKPYLSEAVLRQWIECSLAIFPDKPVEIGDSWKRESILLERYPMIVEDTFTLKEIKRRIATVEVVSTVKPHLEAEPEIMGGGLATVRYEFSGKHQGQISFKTLSGMIAKNTAKKDLSGQIKMMIAFGSGSEKSTQISIKEVNTFEMSRRREDEERIQDLEDEAEAEAKEARRKAERAEARRKAEEAKKKAQEGKKKAEE